MKWNELQDGAKVELTEDLKYLPDHALEPGMLYTHEEFLSLLEVAYAAGTIFTFDRGEEFLYDPQDGIVTQVSGLDDDIPPRFKVSEG